MIHIIIGTKAQLVKMAPIMACLQRHQVAYNFIYTSQHKERMGDLIDNFAIKQPDVTMCEGRSDVIQIGGMAIWILRCLFEGIWRRKSIFKGDRNGIVLVHGDTFSTLLGAVLGRIAGLRVGHVESGLRSFNLFHPFPEEITRLLTFKLADVYFCPGDWAVNNLKRERGQKVDMQANTLYDALTLALSRTATAPVVRPETPYVVISMHRYENIFKRAQLETCVALIEIVAARYPCLFILHLPTEKNLKKHGLYARLADNPNIELRPRYDYFNFVALLEKSLFLLTDGGSNQEECSYMGLPCLLLRKATERQEGLNRNTIISAYQAQVVVDFIDHLEKYRFPMQQQSVSPSEKVVAVCRSYA